MSDERDEQEDGPDPAGAAPPLLAVTDVSIAFGGIRALEGVTLNVDRGQTLALIGPNGAGKSTLFNCLSRLYTPNSGRIEFDGHDLLARSPHEVVDLGIGRTFQNVALFSTMTVAENLLVGAHHWSADKVLPAVFRTPRLRRTERAIRLKALEIIDYLDLGAVAARLAGALPFPTQKRIELGRALMANPELLLLDEPAGGLNTTEVAHLSALLAKLREDYSLTMILVEHRMSMVMSLSHSITVLDTGRVIARGTPHEIQHDPAVIAAYLGEKAARTLEDES